MAQQQNQPQTPPQDQRPVHRVLIKVNIVTIGLEMENVKRIRLIWTKVVARAVISAMAVAVVGKIVTISQQIVIIGQELVNVREIQLIWDPIALKVVISADNGWFELLQYLFYWNLCVLTYSNSSSNKQSWW